MWPSVPQSITQIVSHGVACVSLARGSTHSMLLSVFLESFLSFFLSIIWMILWLPAFAAAPPPSLCLHSSLIPHHCSGGRVYWKKERLVPGGPDEWSCSWNKGAFTCIFLQRSGFLAEYCHPDIPPVQPARCPASPCWPLIGSTFSAFLCRILIGQACLCTCWRLSSQRIAWRRADWQEAPPPLWVPQLSSSSSKPTEREEDAPWGGFYRFLFWKLYSGAWEKKKKSQVPYFETRTAPLSLSDMRPEPTARSVTAERTNRHLWKEWRRLLEEKSSKQADEWKSLQSEVNMSAR